MRDRFLSRVAVACLANAISLAESADLLANSGRLGPAISLYVLACEELAKGSSYRSAADGLSSFDPKDLGKTWVFDRKHLTEHELKHFEFAMSAMTPAQVAFFKSRETEIMKAFGDFELEIPFPEKLPAGIQAKVDKILHSDPALDREMEEIRNLAMRMEDLKERGFYVDVRDGQLLTPADADVQEFRRLRQLFQVVLSAYSDGIAGAISPAKTDFHRRVADELAKHQKRPTGKGFRRGDFSGKRKPRLGR